MKYVEIVSKKIKSLMRGGFFHIFFGSVLVKLIAFFSSIVVVRLVDKSAYAYLTYADNLYNYALAFAGLGMPSAICKYCAVAKSKEEDKAYLSFALKYSTLFQFIVSCIVVIYVTFFDIPFPSAKGIVYVLFFYPILSNVLSIIMGYVRAHEKNQLYSKMSVIQTLLVFMGSVLFVRIWGISGIAGARYIAILTTCYCAFSFIRGEISRVKKYTLESREIKSFMTMSVSLMIANLFSLIIPINETMLISELLRSEEITANYKVATMIPAQLPFVTQSIVIYYFTIIAKMKDKKKIWQLSKKIGFVTTGIITGISFIGIILGKYIIRYVYGAQYEDAILLSNLFWIVNAINASVRMLPMNFLPAIGSAKINAVVAAGSCLVHVIGTYLCIRMFGIWGAGISSMIVYIGSAIVYWVYFRRKCMEGSNPV